MLVADSDRIAGRQAGRLIPKSRPFALELGNYLDADAIDYPARTNRREKAATAIKRMYCNDSKGCCVIASRFHQLGVVSAARTGTPILGTDQEVLSIYHYFSPWDTGCNMTQVYDYQRATGIKMGGQLRKIDGYVAVNYRNKGLLMAAIDLFGVLGIGLSLPADWYRSDDLSTWGRTNARIVGGHEVAGDDYDEQGVKIATWAGERTITWEEITSGDHVDEVYVPLLTEWYDEKQVAVSGLQVAELRGDLDKIGGGTIPPIAAPPVIDWSGVA